jgi:hypothetical protein
MLKDEKKNKEVISGYKQFENRFHRRPSLDELASMLVWKKSTLRVVVERLVEDGKMQWDLKEDGTRVYKSLQLV